MRIVLGSDHRGDGVAGRLSTLLETAGHQVHILGACGSESRDYPDSAWLVANAVAAGQADRGVLICGSGIGMSIAANKVHGVRAALVSNEFEAQMSRRHNNANVLCLAADLTAATEIQAIVATWIQTDFDGGRHARRVEKIHAIERGEDPSVVVSRSQA